MRFSAARAGAGAFAVVVAACLAGCASSAQGGADNPAGVYISGVHQDTRFKGAEPAVPYTMPDVTLRADNGQPFNLVTDTAYPNTLVFFGYTNCPDVCPLVLNELASVYVQLPDDVRKETQVLFITTDPARDSEQVLNSYLSRFNPAFVGLTGRLAVIKSAAGDMGVAITGTKRLPDGGYDVGHGAQVIGFHGDRAPVIWTEGTPPSAMVSDIETLARS